MKKLFQVVLLSVFIACTPNPSYYSVALKEKGLKGNVKSIKICDYYSTAYDFDESGKLIEEKSIDNDGKVTRLTRYVYNDENKLIEERLIDPEIGKDYEIEHVWYFYEDGLLKEKSDARRVSAYVTRAEYFTTYYEYDNGKLAKELEERGMEGNLTTIYSYPGPQTVVLNIEYPAVSLGVGYYLGETYSSESEMVRQERTKTYDKAGRLISEKWTIEDDFSKEKEIREMKAFYNKQGDCIKSIGASFDRIGNLTYDFNEKHTYTYDYVYDAMDNWVKLTLKNDGELVNEYTREIVYY